MAAAGAGYHSKVTDTQPHPADEPQERQRWIDQKQREVEEENTSGAWHRGMLKSSSVSSTHASIEKEAKADIDRFRRPGAHDPDDEDRAGVETGDGPAG